MLMTLREVFRHAKKRTLPPAWLYLPSEGQWTLDTEGMFLDLDIEEKNEEEVPLVALRKNLREALDDATIQQVVDWADELAGREDDAARLDVFRYYFRFDAFPDKLGAPDPPPWEETALRLDREFYDSLGDERLGTKCLKQDCSRGTVRFSTFCRVHQFEQVRKAPCPFHH